MPAAETPVAYLGIDVGKSSHSACALDAGGGVAFRAELANRPDDIDRLLERAGSGALVVVDQKRNIGALVLALCLLLRALVVLPCCSLFFITQPFRHDVS